MSKSLLIATAGNINRNKNTTDFWPVVGFTGSFTGTAANRELPLREAGNIRNFAVNCYNNTLIAATATLELQVNRVASALTLSWATLQTGIKEDTANTVAIVSSDEINYKLAITTEVPATLINISVASLEFEPTTSGNTVSLPGMHMGGNFSTASATRYMLPFGNGLGTTEANRKLRMRVACTLSNLYFYVNSNARTTNTVIRVRKNGANGNSVLTYTSTQTGAKEDTTNSDSFVVGDDFNYMMTTSTGTGAINLAVIGGKLLTTNGSFFAVVDTSLSSCAASTTYYSALSAQTDVLNPGGDANSQITTRLGFTAKELGCYVSANTFAGAVLISLRQNGVDTSLSVSYSSSQTGLKNDSTNLVSVSAGDELNYSIATPASGSITPQWIGLIGNTPSSNSNFLMFFGPQPQQ